MGSWVIVVLVLAFTSSLLVSFFTIPFCISVAFARGILDNPTSLKNHAKPTPYFGGLAVFTSFIIGLALFFPVTAQFNFLLIGSTLLLLVGLADDLLPLKPAHKFFGQIIAAFCFLKGGFYFKEQFLWSPANEYITYLFIAASFVWILSMTNAINLIDIMDGLASIVSLGALASFFCCAVLFDNYDIALLIAIMAGAITGFLYFNKPPARVYLGDAGSLFIGGILAILPFTITWGTYTSYGFLTPGIILAIPLIELVTLIVVRTYKKIPFYLGSHDHFIHYLQRAGWSKRSILKLMVLGSGALLLIAALFCTATISLIFTLTLLLTLLIFWYALLVGKIPVLF